MPFPRWLQRIRHLFFFGAGQVDKLVQLLESPIFLRLRLQLLDVDSPSYPALLKSLYGILMLLPQVRRAVASVMPP